MTDHLVIIQTRDLNDHTKQQLFDLWNNEYPEKLSFNDLTEFDNYLHKQENLKHFLLVNEIDLILGWALTFDRENEKWFVIILSETIKGKGWGRKMLEAIKQVEPTLNGWVIDHNNDKKKNSQPYISPLKFYEKSGFGILNEVRLELDMISAVKINWVKDKH